MNQNFEALHQFRKLSDKALPAIRWATIDKGYLQNLNRVCVNWFMENMPKPDDEKYDKKMRFAAGDLLPNKVGALGGDLTQCVPVSWAALMQMVDTKKREAIPKNERFFALAAVILIETRDKKFPLSFRSEEVALYPSCYHVTAAGTFDINTAMENGLLGGLVETAHKEAKEEVNLDDVLLYDFEPVGTFMSTEPDSATIDIAFSARVDLTGKEVLELAREAKDGWEGSHRLFTADEVVGLLKKPVLVPSAAGTLATYLGL